MVKSIRNLLLVILIILALYLMHTLRGILLPLVFAIMFVLLYQPLFAFMHRKKIPVNAITPILAVGTITILTFVIQIFIDSTQKIYNDRSALVELLVNKILSIFDYLNSILPINLDATLLESWINNFKSEDFISSFAGTSVTAIGSFGSSFFMFALYFLILLFSMQGYERYMKYIAGSDQRLLLHTKKIQKSIVSYMIVKFIVSSVTGLIAFVVCLIFDVNYAAFWGFATFSLNFIPTIGSIIATILPTLMAFVQFESLFTTLLFVSILFGIQLLIGQLIEPRIMGNRLQLNTVTIIFGLVFWAFIWGIAGAFLSVPLLVILKIFLQNNDSFMFIGRVMGRPE